MCLAFPGKVISINEGVATIDYEGETREANIVDLDINVGDYVVVQNKLILQSVPEMQAIESIEMWKKAINNHDEL